MDQNYHSIPIVKKKKMIISKEELFKANIEEEQVPDYIKEKIM